MSSSRHGQTSQPGSAAPPLNEGLERVRGRRSYPVRPIVWRWCHLLTSDGAMRSVSRVSEPDGRIAMSISQPRAIRKRRRRSSEYSWKLPRSRRDRSDRDKPSAHAASAWVVRCWPMMSSTQLTSSAFSGWESASGRSGSANTLPLPRSTETLGVFNVQDSRHGWSDDAAGRTRTAPLRSAPWVRYSPPRACGR